MASADPGFALMPVAEDPLVGGLEKGSGINDQAPVAPDQFDPKNETSKWEIWAYYSYYIGNNGLTLFNFAPTAFQNLLSEAAGDVGTLRFAGVNRTINSIVLVSNGISFAIQIVLFLIVGSYAGMNFRNSGMLSVRTDGSPDFGHSRPNILIVLSIVAFAIGFTWMGVYTSNKWHVAAGLYIVGCT